MKVSLIKRPLIVLGMSVLALFSVLAEAAPSGPLSLDLRRLRKMDAGQDQWQEVFTHAQWEPARTAAVICDMWDRHWCKGATARVAEMAPRMNDLLTELRRRGVLIIHCPSDTMKYYEGTPERKLAQSAPPVETKLPLPAGCSVAPAQEPPLPIDDSDGGCDDDPHCQWREPGSPWHHEIATLQIKEGDAITDSAEALHLMRQRGITNVLIMGVHENMCILGRPFGIRQMVGHGQNVALIRDLTDTSYNSRRKPYVDHFTGTDLVCWHIEKYWCPTITSDQILGGKPFRFAADAKAPRFFHNFVKVPKTDNDWQRVASYMEETPPPDYWQAPEAAREAFRDLKFGVRIHWGLYSILHTNESGPLLRMSNEKRQQYQELYHDFNPTAFKADEWMDLFQRDGIKVMAITAKHHEGFSLFDTQTRVKERVNWTAPNGPQLEDCDLAYSVMDSPFKRDIIRELCDAAHRHGIKIDLYFSHIDWYDADFRPYGVHPLQVPSSDKLLAPSEYQDAKKEANLLVVPDPTPEETARMIARHRQQLTELLTRYGKIDMMCLDKWLGPAVWPQLRQTIKYVRALQPDVMLRCRGIGNYGDYYTPERYVPASKENTDMPWMVIYPLGGRWAYQPDASKYQDGRWILRNLVDCVAKGGNFMVGIGPDEHGRFHPKAVEALDYAGAWLRINGEAIYGARPRPGGDWKEGDAIRFTQSKDARFTYALALGWPGDSLLLRSVRARPKSEIHLLGADDALPWQENESSGLSIAIPSRFQEASNRPCRDIYVFKIESEAGEATPN